MVINIPTPSNEIIKAYLLCLNPLLKLKPREIELLDAMLKVYFNLKGAAKKNQIKAEDIDKNLNDPAARKVIRDLIKMSEASYYNHYGQLKKKKVITEDDKIIERLKNLDSEDLTINYKFKVVKLKPVLPPKPKEYTTEEVIAKMDYKTGVDVSQTQQVG